MSHQTFDILLCIANAIAMVYNIFNLRRTQALDAQDPKYFGSHKGLINLLRWTIALCFCAILICFPWSIL